MYNNINRLDASSNGRDKIEVIKKLYARKIVTQKLLSYYEWWR